MGTLADLPFALDASVALGGSLPGPAHAVVEVSLKGSAAYKVLGS